MKAGKWFGLGVIVSLVVVAVLAGGWVLWERTMWRWPALAASMAQDGALACGQTDYGMGPGIMRSRAGRNTDGSCEGDAPGSVATCDGPEDGAANGLPCVASGGQSMVGGVALSIDDAYKAVEGYLENSDYAGLEIDEVMEFEQNFYAIVKEPESGIGAMELLIDKRTGAVSPEIGPNMMWNARYGMRRRGGMMGQSSETNTVDETDTLRIAQNWLDKNRPGVVTEEHADPFYGYYTVHTLGDGDIDGMLSVHGTTGQVWYHTWHGEFVQMVEGDEH